MARGDKEKKDKLSAFLNRKMIELINRQGKPMSQNEFASYVGVPGMSMSRYMTGNGLPDLENQIVMARALGPEIFDICGNPRLAYSDPEFQIVLEAWPELSKDERRKLIDNLKTMTGKERAHAPDRNTVAAS